MVNTRADVPCAEGAENGCREIVEFAADGVKACCAGHRGEHLKGFAGRSVAGDRGRQALVRKLCNRPTSLMVSTVICCDGPVGGVDSSVTLPAGRLGPSREVGMAAAKPAMSVPNQSARRLSG
ncbi:hypothetical protein J2X68_007740 [Streptomyces sp. 3330]|nr:hypothetical protein [Streptomyces sp. 3330]